MRCKRFLCIPLVAGIARSVPAKKWHVQMGAEKWLREDCSVRIMRSEMCLAAMLFD